MSFLALFIGVCVHVCMCMCTCVCVYTCVYFVIISAVWDASDKTLVMPAQEQMRLDCVVLCQLLEAESRDVLDPSLIVLAEGGTPLNHQLRLWWALPVTTH